MKTRIIKRALSYNDVLILPKYSCITSRSTVSTTTSIFDGTQLKQINPIIASPMNTVCGIDMCAKLLDLNCLGILHRGPEFNNKEKLISAIKSIRTYNKDAFFGIAIGINDEYINLAISLVEEYGIKLICVDVANGYNKNTLNTINYLRARLKKCHIMAGNVATAQGYRDLAISGCDSIRCGIGGGCACVTSTVTGVGVPTFQTILDCAEERYAENLQAQIIADGGCATSGDVAKAIGAGADFVMLGSMLAGTSHSPGQIYHKRDNKFHSIDVCMLDNKCSLVKEYKGMASYDVQVSQGKPIDKIIPEGVSGFVKYTGETSEMINKILGGLRSAMSYCNASSIDDFRGKVDFCEITQNGFLEKQPRVL